MDLQSAVAEIVAAMIDAGMVRTKSEVLQTIEDVKRVLAKPAP